MSQPPRHPVVGDLVLVLPGYYWPPLSAGGGRVPLHVTVSEGCVGYVRRRSQPSNQEDGWMSDWMHVWLPGHDDTVRLTMRTYDHRWRFVDLIDEKPPWPEIGR